jgi:hypothetical protein
MAQGVGRRDHEEDGGDGGQATVPHGEPPTREPDRGGVRRRRKLTQRLEEQLEEGGELTATTDLMVAGGPDHTLRFAGGFLSNTGGPAMKLSDLLSDLVRLVEATFPKAEPE